MTPSWRKPAGMLLIVVLITAWCAGVASLSNHIIGWHWAAQLGFFVIAGVAWLWVLPLKRLLYWMEHGRWR